MSIRRAFRETLRLLRYLEKSGVIAFAAAPGDSEVDARIDETLGESDPVLARQPW